MIDQAGLELPYGHCCKPWEALWKSCAEPGTEHSPSFCVKIAQLSCSNWTGFRSNKHVATQNDIVQMNLSAWADGVLRNPGQNWPTWRLELEKLSVVGSRHLIASESEFDTAATKKETYSGLRTIMVMAGSLSSTTTFTMTSEETSRRQGIHSL